MNKQLQWKFLVVLAVIGFSVYGIARYGIQLGLDLKGGTMFKLRMDVSKIDPAGRGQAVQQAIEGYHKYQQLTQHYAQQVVEKTRAELAMGVKKKPRRKNQPRPKSPWLKKPKSSS